MRVFIPIAAVAALLSIPAAAAPPQPLGEVKFQNSGVPGAQSDFLRGVALLHNFEYRRAAKAFQAAQSADPHFVMAYWGEAMTHNHPVWMEQDLEKARAVLARLGPSREARSAKAKTARERAYLDAVEVLYGDGTKEERDHRYSAKMKSLSETYPDDIEAGSLYALSLLGLAHNGRDHGLYMKSAALLEELYPSQSRHPGILHYLIHSYDDPVHARLGLRMARTYGSVAADAPHAIHMTSHIFLALGIWEDVIRSNKAAVDAANALRAAEGRSPTSCGHANEWLSYGLHQVGRHEAAIRIVDNCRADARGDSSVIAHHAGPAPDRTTLSSWADMAVRAAVETGKAPAVRDIALDKPQALPARFTLAYMDVLLAASDLRRTREAHSRLKVLHEQLSARPELPYMPRRRQVILAQAAALEMIRSGKIDEGLVALAAAAELEKSMPAEFGPPAIEKPTFELLGDELRKLGRFAEAARAYRTALALAPGRKVSVAGLDAAEAALRGGI